MEDLKWYLMTDEENEKLKPWDGAIGIKTSSIDDYNPPEIVLWVASRYENPKEIAEHICHLQHQWLEAKWDDDAYFHAVEKDD